MKSSFLRRVVVVPVLTVLAGFVFYPSAAASTASDLSSNKPGQPASEDFDAPFSSGSDHPWTTAPIAIPADNLSGLYIGALFCTSAKGAYPCGAISLGYNLHDAVIRARAALGGSAGGGNMVSAVTVIYDHQIICGVGLSSDPPCD